MRVNVDGAVGLDIGDGHRGADRCVLHEGKMISGVEFLVCSGERRRYVAFVGGAFCNFRGGPIGFFPERIVELFVPGKAFPFTPFCCGGNLLRSLNGFPFARSDDSNKIPFHNDLRIGKF